MLVALSAEYIAMLAGHIGAALVIGRAERRINIGAIIFAALLFDSVLWFFVLLGWESVTIPPHFATARQLVFVFPYSHGLLAATICTSRAQSKRSHAHSRGYFG
jgi:hypothetical protein